MNPIYKFELSANGSTQQAKPIYKDSLAKDFEKESGQEFFRAKLSGELTFNGDDYNFIVLSSFDTQFGLEIFISYDWGQTWASYWTGTFWKTDCKFDEDSHTVKVKPTVSDQYNDVLAGLDKEYNLIDLAPQIIPVKADNGTGLRPGPIRNWLFPVGYVVGTGLRTGQRYRNDGYRRRGAR